MNLDLATLIKSAPAVLTVTIPPGVYPAQTLQKLAPASPVRIICTGVTFAGLTAYDCANLTFEGLSVLQPAVATDTPAVKLQNCVSVVLASPRITGTASPDGLYWGKAVLVSGGSHNAVLGGEVSGFFKGVNPSNTDDFTLSGCDIHTVRTTPVTGFAEHGLTITNNHIHDIIPSGTDHSDGIHIFTKGQTAPCDGLTISGNLLEQANAAGTLGINLEGTAQSGFTNHRITGNTLRWNNNQGITLNYVLSGEISGNTLSPTLGLDDPKHAPTIIVKNRVIGPPSALKITGNTCKKIVGLDPAYGVNTYWTDAQITALSVLKSA